MPERASMEDVNLAVEEAKQRKYAEIAATERQLSDAQKQLTGATNDLATTTRELAKARAELATINATLEWKRSEFKDSCDRITKALGEREAQIGTDREEADGRLKAATKAEGLVAHRQRLLNDQLLEAGRTIQASQERIVKALEDLKQALVAASTATTK